MRTFLEKRIKYYDNEYRAGRPLISDSQFDELERKTLINIVKDKYAREVMLVNNKINKILIKNKYNFESRDSYFNFNLKCLNKHL